MAYICDDFFVRTIEVISDKFNIPDDVAGATLMALGCNGPEMALNTISIFQKSDIGVGAVVGGEVFNVLVIVGTALLATPDKYMPLKIGKFSFYRDVFFYCISVLMLWYVLKDGKVSRMDSVLLLCGAVVYSTTVAFSAKMRTCFHRVHRRATRRPTAPLPKASSVREIMNPPRDLLTPVSVDADEDEDSDIEGEVDEALVEQWDAARTSCDPSQGSVVRVRTEVRSRLADKSNARHERYMFLTESLLMVSAGVDPDYPKEHHGRDQSMVFEYIPNKERKGDWHHGGIVNNPCRLYGDTKVDPLLGLSEDIELPLSAKQLGLDETPWEIIPFDDILYVDPVSGTDTMFTIHCFPHSDVHDEEVEYGRLLTVEFTTKSLRCTTNG